MSAARGGDGYCYSAPQSIVDGISAKQACCICCDNYPRWEHYTYKQIACHKANDFIEIKHEPTYEIYDPMVWQYGSNGLTSVQPMVSSAYPKIAFSDFKTPRECLYAIQFQGYGRKNFHPKTFAWQYVSGGRSRCFYANPQMSDKYLEELEYMYTCIGGVNVEGSQLLNTYQHNDFAAIEQIWNSVTAEPVVTTTPEPVVTTTPEPVVTTTPEPVVTTTPEPVVTTTPEPVVTTTPEPVVTTTPEPVVTTTPEPVVTTTPEPVVTTTPEPVVTTPPALPFTVVEGACFIGGAHANVASSAQSCYENVQYYVGNYYLSSGILIPWNVIYFLPSQTCMYFDVSSSDLIKVSNPSAESCTRGIYYEDWSTFLRGNEPVVTTTPEPVVTTTPEPVVTTTPEPVVTTTPEPVVTTTPEAVVTTTPEPVVTTTPEPVVTTTPEPVVTTTPEPVVTTTPEPQRILIIAGCVAAFVIVLAAIYGCYKYKAKAAPYAPDSGLTAYHPMINTRDMKNAINSEFLT
jgi:outer membrane biosynthesis protein TonB